MVLCKLTVCYLAKEQTSLRRCQMVALLILFSWAALSIPTLNNLQFVGIESNIETLIAAK